MRDYYRTIIAVISNCSQLTLVISFDNAPHHNYLIVSIIAHLHRLTRQIQRINTDGDDLHRWRLSLCHTIHLRLTLNCIGIIYKLQLTNSQLHSLQTKTQLTCAAVKVSPFVNRYVTLLRGFSFNCMVII